jgi:hypothetical protein
LEKYRIEFPFSQPFEMAEFQVERIRQCEVVGILGGNAVVWKAD